MVGVTVVSILELSSGIIAACIPACMPFIAFRKQKERTWYSLSKMRQTQSSGERADAGVSNLQVEKRHSAV